MLPADSKLSPITVAIGATAVGSIAYYLYRLFSAPVPRNVVDLIGNTPILEIESLSKLTGCRIIAKLEVQNPGGSAKDRFAKAVVESAEKQGRLRPGHRDCVFEGTSGSTGISLATVCNAKGYEAHIVIPDDTSAEKVKLLRMLGAHLHLVPPAGIADPNHYVNFARTLANETDSDDLKAIFADQFENTCNFSAHYTTTGPEIVNQVGKIDAFVSGSGTGGTISGVGKYLKERNRRVQIVLADPPGSGLYNKVAAGVMYDVKEKEGTRRRHQADTIVEGIGLNRITANFKIGLDYIDEAMRVSDDDAVVMAHHLVSKDGIFVGSSSAVNFVAAYQVAQELGPGHTIVTVWCDSGMRHLSKFWAAPIEQTELAKDLARA